MAMFEFPNPDGVADKKKILQFEVRGWVTNREGFGEGRQGRRQQLHDQRPQQHRQSLLRCEGLHVQNVKEWKTFLWREARTRADRQGFGQPTTPRSCRAIREHDQKAANAHISEVSIPARSSTLANISYRLAARWISIP